MSNLNEKRPSTFFLVAKLVHLLVGKCTWGGANEADSSSCDKKYRGLNETDHFQQIMVPTNNGDTRIPSIAPAIMQNTCPNLILAPLQLGLGVQTHRQFRSKFFIMSLHSQGFSLSHVEILIIFRLSMITLITMPRP